MNSYRQLMLVLACTIAAACAPSTIPAGPLPADAGPGASDAAPLSGLTYREHVAPILATRCVRCHAAGGIGPFPLDTYDIVSGFADRIAQVTRARTMPPYYADDSGECRTHRDSNFLTEIEIATLEGWAATPGHPEGDLSIALPEPIAPPELDRVDSVIDLGFTYTPTGDGGGDLDEIRCFLVDPGLTSDRFLTGYHVRPGEPRVVHHMIVFAPDTADANAQAAVLDAEDTRPGWRCDGGPRLAAHPVVLWAPGGGATHYPATTGLRLVGGRPVVMQIHYNIAAGSLPDRTTVELELADSVPLEAQIFPIRPSGLALAPRMPYVEASGTTAVPANALVWGVLPHMHQRGVSMRVEASGGGRNVCLLRTVHWDFQWQQAYFYEEPVALERGMTATITCGYDTTSDSTEVRWGEETSDEMCLNYFYATAMR